MWSCAAVLCALTSMAPATEQPLLGAPDPAAGTQRGIYVKDPRGQIERLTASGTLVAWSVRTPADPHRERGGEGSVPPQRMPQASKVVIADERGGAPLRIELGRRWVASLRLLRGPGGAAEPQLAVRSCASRTFKRCRNERFGLTAAAPLQVTSRSGGADAKAAVEGRLDSGRRLDSAGRPCAAELSVREADGTTRALPRLPRRDRAYTRCMGLGSLLLRGQYAFASVYREDPKYDFEAEFVYGLDLAAGPSARWGEVARPYRYTAGSAALSFGPAVTDTALYWEEFDGNEEYAYGTYQVALPRDLLQEATIETPNWGDPIAPDKGSVCDIAATDAALYELANPRCALDYADGRSGEIRRIVAPVFAPYDEG